jgi:hypothetical protein
VIEMLASSIGTLTWHATVRLIHEHQVKRVDEIDCKKRPSGDLGEFVLPALALR